MLWGIIGAMDEEIDLLRRKAVIKEESVRYGCTFSSGTLEGKSVILVCCGNGQVKAAICADTLIQSFGVDRIVHVGVAGSLQPDLECLDVVVAVDAVYHDMEPGVLIDYFPYCDRFPCDPGLVRLAFSVCSAITASQGRRTVTGHLVSGDQFINDRMTKERLHEQFQASCVEMEGAAVAHVAYVNQLPFLILRTISDSLRDGAILEYNRFKPLACEQSSRMICALLDASED